MKKRYLNLLSARVRFDQLLRRRLLLWSFVWGICGLVGVVFWLLSTHRVDRAVQIMELLEDRCHPIIAMRSDNGRMSTRLQELHSHQLLLTRLDDEQFPYRVMGMVSHSISMCEGGIRIQNLTLEHSREEVDPPQKNAAVTAVNANGKETEYREVAILTLSGVATDNIVLSRFVSALRHTGVFSNVDLKSSVGARTETERTQAYLVECTY